MERKKRTVLNFECADCFHCKTRTFRTATEVMEWCGRKAIKPNKTWINNVVDFGWLRLIWCEMQTDQFCSHGFCPRNASPKHTADITGDVIPTDRKKVVITNQNKNSFIIGAGDTCPYLSL